MTVCPLHPGLCLYMEPGDAMIRKNGFTLIEVLVVVAIMGILSSMGVVGYQSAVRNARVQDASKNVTAFLTRVAQESSRLSTPLCLAVPSSDKRRLNVYKSDDCNSVSGLKPEMFMELEKPRECSTESPAFDCDDDEGYCGKNWISAGGVFKPRIGLSAAPSSGYVAMRYAKTEYYAAAVKSKQENFIRALVCDEEGCD